MNTSILYCKKFFLLLFIIFLSSCSNKKVEKDTSSFKFNEINVEQVDNKGIKQFSFKTKKAKINEEDKSIKAQNSIFILFHNNKPHYRLISEGSTLTGNGDEIQLNSGVRMSSLLTEDFSLQADRIVWIKKLSKATVEGNIKASITGSSFRSDKAIYNHSRNTIEFIDIKEYNYKSSIDNATIKVIADSATWDGQNRKLTFSNSNSQVLTKIKIY